MPSITMLSSVLHKNEATNMISCSLCCEDKPASEIRTMQRCSHESCQDCCVKWIEKAEAGGHVTSAACPFCRVQMTDDETLAILGRPFCPATATPKTLAQELDDLTLQWLNEQTRPCPRCGARIEKVPGGCDLMECLCGYRFCYGCGSHGAQCTCTPSHHFFWDNILDRAAQRAEPPWAPSTNEGIVLLKEHINKRRLAEKAKQARTARQNKRAREAHERMQLDVATSSAAWLFRSDTTSLRILQEMAQRDRLQLQRNKKRQEMIRERARYGDALYGAKWLYTRTIKGGFHVLSHLTSAKPTMIKQSRYRQQIMRRTECANVDATALGGTWLFYSADAKACLHVLGRQVSRKAEQTKRARAQKVRASVEEWGAGLAICNGTWLYKRKTPQKSIQQLARLFESVCRGRYQGRFGLFGRTRLAAYHAANRSNPEAEKQNAIHIRLLFLGSEEEQEQERQEIATYGL